MTDPHLTVESLMRFEAVRLIVDRARQRLLDFQVTQENAAAVVRVCRKLDGIPLAIELATARMGALAVEQVAQRLEVSLDVLKGNTRDAAPRQRTLRATLDWSHDLLSEDERAIFGRLSVFAGGWTLEAAEAVCSGGSVEEGDVLDLLGGLVDKSLVVAGVTTGGAVRYGMLEPVRQYAQDKLQDSADKEVVRHRHFGYFLGLAEEAKTSWHSLEETAWLDRLEAEHDNLRVAFFGSLQSEDPELALRLATPLAWFWITRGQTSEGARWLEEALAKGELASSAAVRAEALTGLGDVLSNRSDFERAEEHLEEAVALWEELGDQGRIAECFELLGFLAQAQRDNARAATLFEKCLAVAQDSENWSIVPHALNGLALIAFDSGNLNRARQLWEESLASARKQESALAVTNALLNMAYTDLATGNHKDATALQEESLTIGRRLKNNVILAGALLGLGIAATLRGEPNRATVLLKEGLTIQLDKGTKNDIAEYLEVLAEAAGASNEDLRAARLWGAAAALRETVGIPWNVAERQLHEPQLIAAQSRINEAVWGAGFADGSAMGLEKAAEYALSEEEPDPSTARVPERSPAGEPMGNLTRREQEVVRLVARGLTNRQISTELGISERTAGNHVSKILRKLELRSRAQIAARAEVIVDATEAKSRIAPGTMTSDE